MPATDELDTAQVRAWAQQHGYTVSSRGRLSADVIAAYRQANPSRGGGRRRASASDAAAGGRRSPASSAARSRRAERGDATATSPSAQPAFDVGDTDTLPAPPTVNEGTAAGTQELAGAVEHIASELAEVRTRLEALERQLAELPSPEEQTRRVVEQLTQRAGEQLAGTAERLRRILRRD